MRFFVEETCLEAVLYRNIIFTEPDVPVENAETVWDRMVFSFDLVGASLTLYNNEKPLVSKPFDFYWKLSVQLCTEGEMKPIQSRVSVSFEKNCFTVVMFTLPTAGPV